MDEREDPSLVASDECSTIRDSSEHSEGPSRRRSSGGASATSISRPQRRSFSATLSDRLPLMNPQRSTMNIAVSGLGRGSLEIRRLQNYALHSGLQDLDDLDVTYNGPTPQDGILRVEAIRAVWTRSSLISAYASIFLISMVTSLDTNTVLTFTPYVTSSFSAHSLLGTVAIVSGIVWASGKGVMAKIGDVFGRVEAFAISILFYSLGYIQMSVSKNVQTYASATIFYVSGTTGMQIMQQIVIADTSTLLNRALLSSLPDVPFLINVWVGPTIGQAFLEHLSWRWGYLFFAILLPVCAMPLIFILWFNQRKAHKQGLVVSYTWNSHNPLLLIKQLCIELDIIGILLLCSGFSLVLIPLNVASDLTLGWHSPVILACMAGGGLCCLLLILWEMFGATYPVIPLRLMKNITVAAGCACGFFYFMAYFVFASYFVSYLQVARFHSPATAGRISEVFSFSATISSVVISLFIKFTARYKLYILLSIPVYLLGLFLMRILREPSTPTGLVILSQVIVGIGGGMFHVPAQLGVQSVSAHQDISIATALFLSITSLGGSVGAAISSALWTEYMPKELKACMPKDTSPEVLRRVFNDFRYAMSFEQGSPERDGIVLAYSIIMRKLCVAALFAALPMALCAWFMKNVELDNVMDFADDPEDAEEVAVESDEEESNSRTGLFKGYRPLPTPKYSSERSVSPMTTAK